MPFGRWTPWLACCWCLTWPGSRWPPPSPPPYGRTTQSGALDRNPRKSSSAVVDLEWRLNLNTKTRMLYIISINTFYMLQKDARILICHFNFLLHLGCLPYIVHGMVRLRENDYYFNEHFFLITSVAHRNIVWSILLKCDITCSICKLLWLLWLPTSIFRTDLLVRSVGFSQK